MKLFFYWRITMSALFLSWKDFASGAVKTQTLKHLGEYIIWQVLWSLLRRLYQDLTLSQIHHGSEILEIPPLNYCGEVIVQLFPKIIVSLLCLVLQKWDKYNVFHLSFNTRGFGVVFFASFWTSCCFPLCTEDLNKRLK